MNIKEQGQDKVLFIAVIALISFGLFMLFSASWVKSLEITGGDSRTYFLVSQMIKLIPAFFIFVLLTKINYRKLQFLSPYLLFSSFLLLVYTQFQGCSGDSCRWLSIGPISFQTSDVARFSMIIFLASYIDNNHKQMKQKDILDDFQVTISSLSVEPLSGKEILDKIKARASDVQRKYLPCVEFLVLCQQELRTGLDQAIRRRGRHSAADVVSKSLLDICCLILISHLKLV